MTTNLTFEEKLVEQMPISGFLSSNKPVGREGFEVVVMEHIGSGWRYYCVLGPGDMLRLSERMLGKFSAYVVDMRPARSLSISDQFATANPLIKMTITAKVLYRVTNSRRVATEVEDPLAKFRDRIVSVLRREISAQSYQKITELLCERWIASVGHVQHLGLAVEGVDSLLIDLDSRVIKGLEEQEEIEHSRGRGRELDQAAHERELRKQEQQLELERRQRTAQIEFGKIETEAEVERKRIAIQNLNLADMNTLMHVHPELIESIFNRLSERDRQEFALRISADQQVRERMLAVIDNYIRQNPDANPDDLMRFIREALPVSTDRPRITFGGSSPQEHSGRITFGNVSDGSAQPLPPPSYMDGGTGDDDDKRSG